MTRNGLRIGFARTSAPVAALPARFLAPGLGLPLALLAGCFQQDLDKKAPYVSPPGSASGKNAPIKRQPVPSLPKDANQTGEVKDGPAGVAPNPSMPVNPSAPAKPLKAGAFTAHRAGSSPTWFPAYDSAKALPTLIADTRAAVNGLGSCGAEAFKKAPFLTHAGNLLLCVPGTERPLEFDETNGGNAGRKTSRHVLVLEEAGVDGATRSIGLALEAIRVPRFGSEQLALNMAFSQSACPDSTSCLEEGGDGGDGQSRITHQFGLAGGTLSKEGSSATRDLLAGAKPRLALDLSVAFASDKEPLELKVRYKGKDALVPLEWREDAAHPPLRALFDVPGAAGFMEPKSAPARVVSKDATFSACAETDPFSLLVSQSGNPPAVSAAMLCWKKFDGHGVTLPGKAGELYAGFAAGAPTGAFPVALGSCDFALKYCLLMADSAMDVAEFTRPSSFRGLTLDVKWDAAAKKPATLEVTFKDGTRKSIPFRAL